MQAIINNPSSSYNCSGSVITSSYTYISASYNTSSFLSGSNTNQLQIAYFSSGSSLSASIYLGSTFSASFNSGSVFSGSLSGSISASFSGSDGYINYSGSLTGSNWDGVLNK